MNRRDEIVTGVFVLMGIALLVVGALWLSEARWRGEYRTLTARLPGAGQLRPGSDVTVRGVRVGEVVTVEVVPEGVEANLRVRSEVPLPERPVVALRPVSLFGDWTASIEPLGRHPRLQRDPPDLPEGVLPGVTAADFSQISDFAGEIAANLEQLTNRLELAFNEETARNVSRAVANFERASREMSAMLEEQRRGFRTFTEDLGEVGEELRAASTDLRTTLGRVEAATAEGQLEAIVTSTRSATARMDSVAGELQGTAAAASRALARADSALTHAERILAGVERGEGSLGRLVADPELYENLAASMAELRALLDDLKTNPQKYFKFSIF